MADELRIYNDTQYTEDRLPAGVKWSDLPTVDEWFAANRVTVTKATRGHTAKPEVVTAATPKRGKKN